MNENLKTYLEKQAEKAENLSFCNGIKVSYIRKNVEEILKQIGKMNLFEEYTMHDISHIDAMLNIAE